jgi:hypothetical protein
MSDNTMINPGARPTGRRATPSQDEFPTLPLPLHPLLREAAEITGLISPRTAGLTLRYGIFIRSESWGERRLVIHELAHTAQYERLGGFQPFLEQYLYECIIPPGYPFGRLEQEARRIERETCA